VGGAIFALEVITGELTPAFGAVTLASVSATAVSRGIFGNYPSFVVPRYELVSNGELLLYALLGLAAGLASVAFIRTLYWLERVFDQWTFPSHFKPLVGGLAVGLIGRFAPGVFGTGTETIEAAVWDRHLPLMLAALVPLKIVATSLTLGSGGSGGVFGPAMFIGAMLGGAFGWAAHLLAPAWTAGSGAYALVGIGAMVGGTALAPLTSIILLFEMTDDYRIILPAMEATVLAIVVTRALVGESIYTLKLKASNIAYYAGREIQQLRAYTVRDVMRFEVAPVDPATPVATALALATRRRLPALVVGSDDRIDGVVTLEALARAMTADPRPETVAEVMSDLGRVRIEPDESLENALIRLNEIETDALVVVSGHDGHALGVVARSDLLQAYQRVLHQRPANASPSSSVQ
jgi:CIC family chloride channel protein